MSNNDQDSEVLSLLRLVLTQVNTLTADMQIVKTDVQDLKLRVSGIENNMVYFATRLQSVEDKVEALDNKVDQKLHDTRPIWQSVLERLDKIEADLATLKQNQERSEQSSQEFRQELMSRFRQLEKDVNFYRKHAQVDVAALAKDIIDIEERLERVESKLEIKN